MVETVSRGGEPEHDAELMALLRASAACGAGGSGAGSGRCRGRRTPRAGRTDRRARPAQRRRRRRSPGAAPRRRLRGAASGDIRVDTAALDAVAERATQVRIMALAGRQVVERIYELARLAEEGLHEPQPTQVLAVLATMLRRVAVELEGGQRRLIRAVRRAAREDARAAAPAAARLPASPSPATPASWPARSAARSRSSWKARRPGSTAASPASSKRRCSTWCATPSTTASSRRRCARPGASRAPAASASGRRPTGREVRLVIAGRRRRHRHRRGSSSSAVDVGLVDAASAAGLGQEEALRLLFAPGFSTRKRGLRDLRPRRRARRGGHGGEPGGRRGLPRHRARPAAPRSRVEVPVARRGEAVMLLRVGQLRLALPGLGGAPRHPARSGRWSWSATAGPSPRSPDRLVPFVPLARALRPARGRPPAPPRGRGLRPARSPLAVDDVEGEQEVLVRPMTRKVRHRPPARGRGAPRLGRAGGRAVARRARPARVPARPAGCARERSPCSGCGSSWWTTRWSPARWSAACWRTPASRSSAAGDAEEALSPARRGALRLRGHRHRDAGHGRLRADRPAARHGALRPAADHRGLDPRPAGGPPARPEGGRRRLPHQAEPRRRRAGRPGAPAERER